MKLEKAHFMMETNLFVFKEKIFIKILYNFFFLRFIYIYIYIYIYIKFRYKCEKKNHSLQMCFFKYFFYLLNKEIE